MRESESVRGLKEVRTRGKNTLNRVGVLSQSHQTINSTISRLLTGLQLCLENSVVCELLVAFHFDQFSE